MLREFRHNLPLSGVVAEKGQDTEILSLPYENGHRRLLGVQSINIADQDEKHIITHHWQARTSRDVSHLGPCPPRIVGSLEMGIEHVFQAYNVLKHSGM